MRKTKKPIVTLGLLLISFVLFSAVCGYSQTSYTRKQLKEFRLVKDMYKELPDSARNIMYEILGKVGGKIVQYEGRGDSLNADARFLVSMADIGSKVYMDVKYLMQRSSVPRNGAVAIKVVK